MSDQSDRVCQFFLRGRCQRDNCEFKHEMPSEGGVDGVAVGQLPVCHLFLTGSCKIGDTCRLRHEKPDKPSDPTNPKDGEKDVIPVAKKSMPPPPMEADVTTDTSTFIASTTIDAQPGQQMTRRVGKVGGDEVSEKEIRRDSKGFENFDDYFESDGNDSTITSGDKTNEITNESIEEESTEIAKETESSEKGMN